MRETMVCGSPWASAPQHARLTTGQIRETKRTKKKSMAFWVYEDWKAGRPRVRIHRGSNDGKEIVSACDPKEAKWHGPFSTIGEATAAGVNLRRVIGRSEWIRS